MDFPTRQQLLDWGAIPPGLPPAEEDAHFDQIMSLHQTYPWMVITQESVARALANPVTPETMDRLDEETLRLHAEMQALNRELGRAEQRFHDITQVIAIATLPDASTRN